MNKTTLRVIVTSFVILLFFDCCQNNKAMTEIEKQNLELGRQIWTEWSNKNIEFFKEVYDSAYTFYSPLNNPKPQSGEEALEGMKHVCVSFLDATANVKELMAAGDKIISTLIFKGTHTKEYCGIPATGNKCEISSINIFRIKDGKIIEEWENFDVLGFYKQLGMELKPKE